MLLYSSLRIFTLMYVTLRLFARLLLYLGIPRRQRRTFPFWKANGQHRFLVISWGGIGDSWVTVVFYCCAEQFTI